MTKASHAAHTGIVHPPPPIQPATAPCGQYGLYAATAGNATSAAPQREPPDRRSFAAQIQPARMPGPAPRTPFCALIAKAFAPLNFPVPIASFLSLGSGHRDHCSVRSARSFAGWSRDRMASRHHLRRPPPRAAYQWSSAAAGGAVPFGAVWQERNATGGRLSAATSRCSGSRTTACTAGSDLPKVRDITDPLRIGVHKAAPAAVQAPGGTGRRQASMPSPTCRATSTVICGSSWRQAGSCC
jgi:hypothetical protein